MPLDVDLALVGGGGAALAVLQHLAVTPPAAGLGRPLRVALLDPVDRLGTAPSDRTWCSWVDPASPGARLVEPAVRAQWDSVDLVDPQGRTLVLDLRPLRYRMVDSADWYRLVAGQVAAAAAAGRLEVVHVPAAVTRVREAAGSVQVLVGDGRGDDDLGGGAGAGDGGGDGAGQDTVRVTARWALDSRPAPPRRPGASRLVQHFAGQRVAVRGAWPSERAVLMDFSVPQPPVGLAFGYVLPWDASSALVEYTEFSPAPLTGEQYAAALGAYRRRVLPPGTGPGVVEHEEHGVIPMSDGTYPRRVGARTWRIGTAGGAVRPSTGYAFAAMHSSAAAIARSLARGGAPVPPRPYPRRHAWMDALVLRGLLDASLDGPAFFTRLFQRNPPERVLRFLDGATSPAQELAVMATAPRAAMGRLAVLDAAGRLRRRLPPGRTAGPGPAT